MKGKYSIRVYKEYFNFAASHFLIFKDGTREPIHGHNYQVRIMGSGEPLDSDMIFDFIHIKPLITEICDSFDHRLLLPKLHPALKFKETATNLEVITPDQSFFSFPKQDVRLLPILNTSVERMAAFFTEELVKGLKDRFQFEFHDLEVEMEESRGQSAIFRPDPSELTSKK